MFDQPSTHMYVQGLSDLRSVSIHNINRISPLERGKTSGKALLTVQTVRKFSIDSGNQAARGELTSLDEIPVDSRGQLLFERKVTIAQKYFHWPASSWVTDDFSWI